MTDPEIKLIEERVGLVAVLLPRHYNSARRLFNTDIPALLDERKELKAEIRRLQERERELEGAILKLARKVHSVQRYASISDDRTLWVSWVRSEILEPFIDPDYKRGYEPKLLRVAIDAARQGGKGE